MATSDDSLEILLNKATDPSMKEVDPNKMNAFCEKVNCELEGPLLSTRLIAHKMQSPQEKEALYALTALEACVTNCGRYFHQEIGKFRFLNEMIKVVSPKYLGNKTTDVVKKRCVEILYSWYKGLAHEPKIGEAYKMLKAQGIVKEDPVYMDKSFNPFPPPKPRKADFEDDEKAQTLERLLKSKHPEDLQAANRLIKNMVKEDAEKTEKRSRCINELESVRNQVKLLTEMITHYTTNNSTREDREMMKELFENLEKQRPNLFRLASDTDEHDNEGINEILKANDSVTRVMTLYKQKVEGESPAGDYTHGAKDSSLLDLGFMPGNKVEQEVNTVNQPASLLENDFKSLGLEDMNDLGNIFGNYPRQQNASTQQAQPTLLEVASDHALLVPNATRTSNQIGGTSSSQLCLPTQSTAKQSPDSGASPFTAGLPSYSAISYNVRAAGSASGSQGINDLQTSFNSSSVTSSNGFLKQTDNNSLADLDILDKSLQDYNLSKDSFPVKSPPVKLPLNQLVANKVAAAAAAASSSSVTVAQTSILTPAPMTMTLDEPAAKPASQLLRDIPLLDAMPITISNSASDFSPLVSADPEPQLLPLTDVFVPLDSIQPAPDIPPVTAYDKNGLKVIVHFSKDRPRPDVLTMVISTISTNTSPISSFVFQAAVPKIMKVKLQPPSASEFAAFKPILPPAAITQVMLVANPRKEKIRLKYKVSYHLKGETVSDVGDVDGVSVV